MANVYHCAKGYDALYDYDSEMVSQNPEGKA